MAGAILRERKDFRQALLLDMIGIEDRFGLSGKPWELLQTFGLTAEHIADRVLGMYLKKRGLETSTKEPNVMMELLECAGCSRKVPFAEYLDENPMGTDDICVECENSLTIGCAECRMKCMRANPNFVFHCPACRKIAVPC